MVEREPAARVHVVEQRLASGASMLRDMIYTAWVRSADPVPQRSYLAGE